MQSTTQLVKHLCLYLIDLFFGQGHKFTLDRPNSSLKLDFNKSLGMDFKFCGFLPFWTLLNTLPGSVWATADHTSIFVVFAIMSANLPDFHAAIFPIPLCTVAA